MSEMTGLRPQILANAKIMLCPFDNPRPVSNPPNQHCSGGPLPTQESSTTLTQTATGSGHVGDLEVVVFSDGKQFTAAVMLGVSPAIEGAESPTPEGAMRKLLIATSEMLHMFMPKLGSHQRNIHGGGVFDEDLISQDLIKAS